jgi:hypothetical protein
LPTFSFKNLNPCNIDNALFLAELEVSGTASSLKNFAEMNFNLQEKNQSSRHVNNHYTLPVV